MTNPHNKKFTSVREVADTVKSGTPVYWGHNGYEVIHNEGTPLVCHVNNGHCVGLFHQDGEGSDYHPDDFFT